MNERLNHFVHFLNENFNFPTRRNSKNYAIGNIIVVLAAAALLYADAVILFEQYIVWHATTHHEPLTGFEGFFVLQTIPFIVVGIVTLLGSLLSTAIRRSPLPHAVRRLRLVVSVFGLGLTLIIIIFWLSL